MSVSRELASLVEQRAAGRCEYCRMHQALQGATFHVEHILPSARGGVTVPENLAWAWPGCNLRKSDRTESFDPDTGSLAPLFNPRTQVWLEHFQFMDRQIIGLTPTGRGTVALLDLNHPRRLLVRQAEEVFGLFPSRH
jgi:hypothetical protein